MSAQETDTGKKALEVHFEPFVEKGLEEDRFFDDTDEMADVPARLILTFNSSSEAQLQLAQALIASYRGGHVDTAVEGQLLITHYDRTLPPSAFDYDRLPEWLQRLVDTYRAEETPPLSEELMRLREIRDAVGSKPYKELKERLEFACSALERYAKGPDGDHAQQTLVFIRQR